MVVSLTKDHKPDDPKERLRLQQCRAIVRPSRVQNPVTGQMVEVGCSRVWDVGQMYGVAMSRSLGDCQARRPARLRRSLPLPPFPGAPPLPSPLPCNPSPPTPALTR